MKLNFYYRIIVMSTILGVYALTSLAQSVTEYPRVTWTVTASSAESTNPASRLIDGNVATSWSSLNAAPFPHTLLFDMGAVQPVNQIYYRPTTTQDHDPTKGSISFSDNGTTFGAEIPITFVPDPVKTTFILPTTQNHRYFRITITENRVTRDFPEDHVTVTELVEVGANFDSNFQTLLSSFKATATNLGVQLDWTKAVEPGLGIYTIERSVDALNFTAIPALALNVLPSNNPSTYTVTDVSVLGTTANYFYRLVLTPVVGTAQRSLPTFVEFPLVTYGTDKPKNLNIYYFIPSDLAAPDDFKHRMDDIMIGMQTYFKNELIRNGRANTTFGMFTDNATHTRVQLHVINGKFPKSGYPRSDSSPIMAEINAYKAANPSPLDGDHNLIMLPVYSIDYNPSLSNPDYSVDGIFTQGPFYGNGKDCFAMDYDKLIYSSLGQDTRDGRNSVKFIGGLVHELAHGLNVPHDQRKVSETALGTTLMSSGNYTFGASTTSVTAADAAILNRNQIFNNDGNTLSYYGPNKASLSSVSACYDAVKKAIIITGTVTTNGSPVTDVSIYNDPDVSVGDFAPGVGTNNDYDAITWTAPVTNSVTVGGTTTARFYIEEPIDELQTKSNSMYEMKLNLIQLDGNTSYFKYRYDFGATVPVMSYAVYTPGSGDGVTGPTLTPISATITASAGTNGTISQSGPTVFSCAPNVTYTVTPALGYVIDKVLVDGVEVAVTGATGLRTSAIEAVPTFTFNNVVANHTIAASFKVNPLPVTLAAFNVELKQKNNALLTWSTTEEVNNSGFDVEMSTDARKFIKVGYVEGNGDSKTLNIYDYTVSDLAGGDYYFRLKQMDYDGKFEYSTIKALSIRNADDIASIYPNPTKDKVKLNANLHKNQAFSVEVANQSGQIVLSLPASKNYANGYELDATKFTPGLYFIVLKGANFTESLKFVKL